MTGKLLSHEFHYNKPIDNHSIIFSITQTLVLNVRKAKTLFKQIPNYGPPPIFPSHNLTILPPFFHDKKSPF